MTGPKRVIGSLVGFYRSLGSQGWNFPAERSGFNGLLFGLALEPREELRGASHDKLLGLGAVVATPSSSVPLSPFWRRKIY